MRPRMIWRVARKEILSTLRDTRAIISNLLIPLILMPVVMLGMPLLLGGLFEREATTITPIGVVGLENLPAEFVAILEAQNVELVPVAEGVAAVQAGDVDVVLQATEPVASALVGNGSTSLQLFSSRQHEGGSTLKVQQAVGVYQQQVVAGASCRPVRPQRAAAAGAGGRRQHGRGRSSGQFSWLIPFIAI